MGQPLKQKLQEFLRTHGSFETIWNEKYSQFDHISLPQTFPPEAITSYEDFLSGIPIITPEFAKKAANISHGQFRDLIYIAQTTDGEYVYPMEKLEGGNSRQILETISLDDFESEFGFTYNAENQGYIKSLYQVNGLLTAGADLFFAARFLQAREIQRNNPEISESYLMERFGLSIRDLSGRTMDLSELNMSFESLNQVVESGSDRELSEVIDRDPAWFSVYLIDQTTQFLRQKEVDPQEINIDWYQSLTDRLSRLTLGVPESRRSETMLLPSIHNSISLLRDLVFAQRTPAVFGIANRAIQERINIPYEQRFNPIYLTMMFENGLLEAEMLKKDDIKNSRAHVYANVKPARSIALRALVDNSELINQIRDLSQEARVLDSNQELVSEMEALDLVNTLCERAINGDLAQSNVSRLWKLIDHFQATIKDRYDLIRCRAFVEDVELFDQMMKTGEKTFGDSGRIYLADFEYSDSDYHVQIIGADQLPVDPASFCLERISDLPAGRIVCTQGRLECLLHLGRTSLSGVPYVTPTEIQIGFQPLTKMYKATERAWRSERRTTVSAGFSSEEINKLQKEAKQEASKLKRIAN